jgi:hypothetical protein
VTAVSNVIKVPKPGRGAYNPNRPLEKNQLIGAQVKHFKEAEQHLPEHQRTGVDVSSIQTEGQAGHYIRRVTRALHENAGKVARKTEVAK